MLQQLMPALRMTIAFTLLTGIFYPLLTTGICQVLFPRRANGSLVMVNGAAAGSELIGQNFTKPQYFHPRPSAAGKDGYDPLASGGSNLGPANKALIDRMKASADAFRKENPGYQGPLPVDLMTASGSGLDPEISPEAAEAQAQRVADARSMLVAQVRSMITQHTKSRDLGFLGEPRVNVLQLNLALDRAAK